MIGDQTVDVFAKSAGNVAFISSENTSKGSVMHSFDIYQVTKSVGLQLFVFVVTTIHYVHCTILLPFYIISCT